MNWDALGAISELTAALAFLVSFLFVGHQLRQNREMERASNQREILNQARSFFALTRSDLRILVAVSERMRDYATANQEQTHQNYMTFCRIYKDFAIIFCISAPQYITPVNARSNRR